MNKFIIRMFINAIGLYAAVTLVEGIKLTGEGDVLNFIWLALIFGLLNALVRPLITVLTCPLIILTLGLGTFLINMLMFYLAGYIGDQFGIGFTTENIWAIALGALIVSVISIVLNLVFKDELKPRKKRK